MLRAAGQGRGRPRGALRSRGRAGSGGIVVQAVLLTVMVMTIGLLAVISRVAGSRDASSASSLQAAARQAAEFGFSEIVAEMNRDRNSYTWVTCSGSWTSVSDTDLENKKIYVAPAGRSTIATNGNLPSSAELSYQLIAYIPPPEPAGASTNGYCTSNTFGSLKGGSGIFTIVGTVRRPTGDATTYTLQRSVTVDTAISPFQQSLLGNPGTVASVDYRRIPSFPTVLLNPGPALSCTAGTGTAYTCTAGTDTYNFDNASQQKFPYPYVIPAVASTSSPPPFCEDSGTEINCRLASLTVGNGSDSLNIIVTALAATSTTAAKPVNLFIDGTLNVATNAKLCSYASSATSVTTCAAASGDWQQLRIYGKASGTCPSQTVQLNAMTTPTADAGKPNLQGAFLWFPVGSLTVGGTITTAQADLRGWVCQRPTPLAGASGLRIWPDAILGAPTAYIFRGYGSRDLPPS